MTRDNLDSFSSMVAETIGEVDPKIVKEIINVSNSQRYIFHGIKIAGSFERINEEGIKGLTPEGGFVSYWTSGRRLFGSVEGDRLQTVDSTFFHYAHSSEPKENVDCMNLAVVKYDDLKNITAEDGFQEDSGMTIKGLVPRELIHLLRVELSPYKPSREKGQLEERFLLSELSDVLKTGYTSGDLTVVKLED